VPLGGLVAEMRTGLQQVGEGREIGHWVFSFPEERGLLCLPAPPGLGPPRHGQEGRRQQDMRSGWEMDK
jgi:hypothetical protein